MVLASFLFFDYLCIVKKYIFITQPADGCLASGPEAKSKSDTSVPLSSLFCYGLTGKPVVYRIFGFAFIICIVICVCSVA